MVKELNGSRTLVGSNADEQQFTLKAQHKAAPLACDNEKSV